MFTCIKNIGPSRWIAVYLWVLVFFIYGRAVAVRSFDGSYIISNFGRDHIWIAVVLFVAIALVEIYFTYRKIQPPISTSILWKMVVIAVILVVLPQTGLIDLLKNPWIDFGYILGNTRWGAVWFALLASYPIVTATQLLPIRLIRIINNKPWLVGLIFFAIVVALYLFIIITKYQSWGYPARDLGIFDQAIWHLSRFEEPASTIRGYANLWADHFHPILIAVAPLYWLWSDPRIILILQGVIIAAGVFPVIGIARLWFPKSWLIPVSVAVVYAGYAGLQKAIDFGFYPENFFAPLALFAVYFLLKKGHVGYWIFITLLLCLKENISLYIVALSTSLLMITGREYRRILFSTVAIALIWFILVYKIVIPHFAGAGQYQYLSYSQLGSSLVEMATTLVTNPLYSLKILTNPLVKLETLTGVLGSGAYLLALTPFSIAALPMLAENFLSDRNLLWVFGFHYQAAIIVPIVLGIAWYVRSLNQVQIRKIVVVWAALSCLAIGYIVDGPIFLFGKNYRFDQFTERTSLAKEFQIFIPADASVTAQDTLAPALTHRKVIYDLPRDIDINSFTTDFVVLTLDYSTFPFDEAKIKETINLLRKNDNYKLVRQYQNTYIFQMQ